MKPIARCDQFAVRLANGTTPPNDLTPITAIPVSLGDTWVTLPMFSAVRAAADHAKRADLYDRSGRHVGEVVRDLLANSPIACGRRNVLVGAKTHRAFTVRILVRPARVVKLIVPKV
jgi:hypothetical protein